MSAMIKQRESVKKTSKDKLVSAVNSFTAGDSTNTKNEIEPEVQTDVEYEPESVSKSSLGGSPSPNVSSAPSVNVRLGDISAEDSILEAVKKTERRTSHLNILIRPSVLKRLKNVCRTVGISATEAAEKAIVMFLDKIEQELQNE